VPLHAATILDQSRPRWCGCSIFVAPLNSKPPSAKALARGAPHPNAVRLALEQRCEQRQEGPPVALDLPAHVKSRDASPAGSRTAGYERRYNEPLCAVHSQMNVLPLRELQLLHDVVTRPAALLLARFEIEGLPPILPSAQPRSPRRSGWSNEEMACCPRRHSRSTSAECW